MVSGSSRFGMVLHAFIAGMFLVLTSWQPGLASAMWADGANRSVATADHHQDDAGTHHEEAAQHDAGDQHDQQSSDHHQPASSMDQCCELHCLMSQAMPASSPLIHGPAADRFRADFGHALPDGQISSVIKPPRTIS